MQVRKWSSSRPQTRRGYRACAACRSRGNAHIWGIIGEQKEAAFAARQVILTAEEIVG